MPDNEIVMECFQQDDSTEAEKSAGTMQLEEVYIEEDEAAYTLTQPLLMTVISYTLVHQFQTSMQSVCS